MIKCEKFSEVVDRIKYIKHLKNDSDVAKLLDMSNTALANRKTRESIPFLEIISFCESENINLVGFLTGKELKKSQEASLPEEEQRYLKAFRELSPDGRTLIAAEAVKRKEQEQQQQDVGKKKNRA